MFNVRRTGSIAKRQADKTKPALRRPTGAKDCIATWPPAQLGIPFSFKTCPDLRVRAFDDDKHAAGKALFVRSPQAIENIDRSGSLQYPTVVDRSEDF